MVDQQLTIFISYSRADSEFVDRLDADLRARGYRTWVDRRRLEGGVDWEREINAAIAACELFLISLSPPAVASLYVRQEFEEGQRLGKRLMPVLYRNYTTPIWLAPAERIQQQDFTNTSAYALNLKRLLYAIQDPTLNLSASTDHLYAQALKMRATDPERAAILLQHIIDREPTYFGGQVQRDLAELDMQLYTSRVARLRALAERAREDGQYGVEAASLEALLTLGRQDSRAFYWAEDYLPIAQQNREFMGPYGVIQQSIADGDTATARTLLQSLWSRAPYFRDPANLAPKLGLALPLARVQDKEVAAERTRFQKACDALKSDLSNQSVGKVRSALHFLAYDLDSSAAISFIDRKIKSEQESVQAQNHAQHLDTHRLSDVQYTMLQWLRGIAAVAYVILCYLALNAFLWRDVANPLQFLNPSISLDAIIGIVVILLMWVALPLGGAQIVWTSTGWIVELIQKAHHSQVAAKVTTARAQAESAYQQWRQLAEQVLQQRIDAINRS